MGEPIKPCPFCGGPAVVGVQGATEKFLGIGDSERSRWFFYVGCLNCGTRHGRMEDHPTDSLYDEEIKAYAIAAWNIRPAGQSIAPVASMIEIDDSGEAMVCTGCGTTKTLQNLRRKPGVFSCCPERNMVRVRSALTRVASVPTKEWCLNMARLEGETEIGAGMPNHPLRDPVASVPESAILAAFDKQIAVYETKKSQAWNADMTDRWDRFEHYRDAVQNMRDVIAAMLAASPSVHTMEEF